MDWERFVDDEVHRHYWDHDDTCAVTTLIIASRLFKTPLEPQVGEAALGMWGAGGYRAQCGLVEGALMFIGVLGGRRGLNRSEISRLCKSFAGEFGSLICRELRPQGFTPGQPAPHLRRSVQAGDRFHHQVCLRRFWDRTDSAGAPTINRTACL